MDVYLGEERNQELIERLAAGEPVPFVGHIAVIGAGTTNPEYELVVTYAALSAQDTLPPESQHDVHQVLEASSNSMLVESADELITAEQFTELFEDKRLGRADWGLLQRVIQKTSLPLRFGLSKDGIIGIMKSSVLETLEIVDEPGYNGDRIGNTLYLLTGFLADAPQKTS